MWMVEVPAPSMLRAHGVEQCCEVGDFGFAGAILHDGFALGQGRGHQQVFGAGDGDFVEDDLAPQAATFRRSVVAST